MSALPRDRSGVARRRLAFAGLYGPPAAPGASCSDPAARCGSCCRGAGARPDDRRPRPGREWDEREAHDLHGLRFAGHEPMRALVAHVRLRLDRAGPRARRAPGRGRPDPRGRHRVRPLPLPCRRRADPAPRPTALLQAPRARARGRGLGRSPTAVAYVTRACAACAVTNTVAYAQAVEQAFGCGRPRPARARTLLLELERLYNHLNDIAAICAGSASPPARQPSPRLKERAQRAQRAPHRPPLPVRDGGGGWRRVALDARRSAGSRRAARAARRRALAGGSCLRPLGPGPARRVGSSRARTPAPRRRRARRPRGGRRPRRPRGQPAAVLRRLHPRVARRDDRRRRRPARECAPRTGRAFELLETCSRALRPARQRRDAPAGPSASAEWSGRAARRPASSTRRGPGDPPAAAHRLLRRTGRRSRTPLPGNLLPDFPLINKSFELCYACVDR